MIHLADVDRAGHARGWLGARQRQAMKSADAELGRLLDVHILQKVYDDH